MKTSASLHDLRDGQYFLLKAKDAANLLRTCGKGLTNTGNSMLTVSVNKAEALKGGLAHLFPQLKPI